MAEKRKPQSGLEWLNQNYGMGPLNELLGLAGGFGRNMEQVINRAGGYSTPSRLTPEQQKALADSVNEADANLFTQQGAVLSDDSDSRQSALTAMRQQYAPGSQFFETDTGQAMIQQAMNNQYEGDAAGLAEFNMNQRKVGIGAIDEIIDAMGYAGTPMEEWARANENLALREFNKKFGNSYAGTGPSDEEIKAAMAAGQFSPSAGSPNPLGETGMPRVSNTAQTAQAQPVDQQRQLNLDEVQRYMNSGVPGLRGKGVLGTQIAKMIKGS